MKKFFIGCGAFWLISGNLILAQAVWDFHGDEGGSAVDAKGARHYSRNYRGAPPWASDLIQGYGPYYPFEDRARHHQGRGDFRLTIDTRTGAVSKVDIIKSTGFTTLDESALAALHRWRLKPGRWKEIEMPVTFELTRTPPAAPRDAIRLPQRW